MSELLPWLKSFTIQAVPDNCDGSELQVSCKNCSWWCSYSTLKELHEIHEVVYDHYLDDKFSW